MSKGVSAIQNIFCVMLGIKYGLNINYNILYSFPDDDKDDYDKMLTIIPMLYHLQPPISITPIAITRDAPLQQEYEKYGLDEPYSYHLRYNILFSEAFKQEYNFDLNNYCYYFTYPFEQSKDLKLDYSYLIRQMNYWQETYKKRKIRLFYQNANNEIVFTDTRYSEAGKVIVLDKIAADVYKECECVIVTQKDLILRLISQYSEEKIMAALEDLSKNRLIYVENEKILGLAFHESTYAQYENKPTE